MTPRRAARPVTGMAFVLVVAAGCIPTLSTDGGAVLAWHSPDGVEQDDIAFYANLAGPADGIGFATRWKVSYIAPVAGLELVSVRAGIDTGACTIAWSSGALGGSSYECNVGAWWSTDGECGGACLELQAGRFWYVRETIIRAGYVLLVLDDIDEGTLYGHGFSAGIIW